MHEPASWGGLPAQQAIIQRCPDDVWPSGAMPDTRANISVATITIRATRVGVNRPMRKLTRIFTDSWNLNRPTYGEATEPTVV